MKQIRVNQLPTPTYRWLGVNDAIAELPEAKSAEPCFTAPDGIEIKNCDLQSDHILSESQNELSSFFADSCTFSYLITGSSEQPLHVQIPNNGSNFFFIHAKSDSKITVIMHTQAEHNAFRTQIKADPYAAIKLVQIIRNGKSVSDIDADIAENAHFELVQIFLESDNAIAGTTVSLKGRNSVFTSNIGYLLDHNNALDINLNIIQNGKKSESETDVKGVLRGSAKKTFRGTIDFRNGASGAKGAEREDVLLMNSHVQNKTVPVILCAEEDVAGSHGASIGQIDASHIFYMQSRGIPEDRITEIIAQSKLGSVIRAIGDPETERSIYLAIGKEDPDE